MKKNNQLEVGNHELIASLENMNEELKNSNTVIENLEKELDKHKTRERDYGLLQEKWVDAKKVYQSRIDDLKKLLNNTERIISLDKYHEALELGQVLRQSLTEKEREIKILRQKVSALELQVSGAPHTSTISKSVKPDIVSLKENLPMDDKQSHFSSSLSKNQSPLKKNSKSNTKKSGSTPRKRAALANIQVNSVTVC